MRALLSPPIAAAAASVALIGCSQPTDDPRVGFLHSTLVDDNRPWLVREPELTAFKLQKMAGRPYDFFRGSAAQFWRDVSTPVGPVDARTVFGDGPSSLVWLVGDPHLENVGAFRAPDGALLVDWNDYDAAGYGPWWNDLRRLVVAFHVAATELPSFSPSDVDALGRAVVAGYADEIAALAAGGAGVALREGDGAIVDELIDGGRGDGDSNEKLDEYAPVGADGQRAMFYGDLDDRGPGGRYEDTLVPVGARERDTVAAVIARWRGTVLAPVTADAVAIKGVSRRLGAGVASYPLLRWYVLLEGPSAEVDDDWLLEVKETGDGVRIPALPRFPDVGFPSAAARVVASQRVLGERADADELLGWGDVAPLSFKVRHRTGYQKGLDVVDIVDEVAGGGWTLADVEVFAAQCGRLLARAHGRAPTAAGDRGGDVIAPLIAGRQDALADETAAFAAAYARLVVDDTARLADLIEAEGPLLGFTAR